MQTNTGKCAEIQRQIDKLSDKIQQCYKNIESYEQVDINTNPAVISTIAAYEEEAQNLIQRRAKLVQQLNQPIRIAMPFSQLYANQQGK